MMIKRYRGDDYPMEWTLQINGAAVNLTGYLSVTFSIKKEGAVVSIAGVISDAVNGKVTFTPATTDFDTAGTYFFDIQAVDGASKKRTYAKDKIEIIDDVNKG